MLLSSGSLNLVTTRPSESSDTKPMDMHTPMQLRKNSEIINQQAKRLVKFVLANPGNRKKGGNNYLGQDELEAVGFSGIKYLTAEERVVLDHGWVFYPNLLKGHGYDRYGKTLEGLFRSRSNSQNWNRSINIKSKATKGQRLLEISIRLIDPHYERNYVLVNEAGKIVPCQFAAMQSHNWDEDSDETLALIKEPEPADVYDWDQDDDPDRGMEVRADEY